MGVNPCSQFAIVTCSTTHTSVELGRPGTFYARLLYCMHFVLKSFWARPSQSLHVICRICRRLLASNSLKAGPSSPAHGRDGERAAAEEWMMRPNPYFQRALWQLRSEEQTNTPTLLHSPPWFFVWKQLTRTLHPIRRLHLHPCVCCSPRRGSNGHTELQLFMTDGERERETESDVLTSHCYWLRATNHCPMADTQKHPKHWKSEKIICWWETQDV